MITGAFTVPDGEEKDLGNSHEVIYKVIRSKYHIWPITYAAELLTAWWKETGSSPLNHVIT